MTIRNAYLRLKELDSLGVRGFYKQSESTGMYSIECYRKRLPNECNGEDNWKFIKERQLGLYSTRDEALYAALEMAENIYTNLISKSNNNKTMINNSNIEKQAAILAALLVASNIYAQTGNKEVAQLKALCEATNKTILELQKEISVVVENTTSKLVQKEMKFDEKKSVQTSVKEKKETTAPIVQETITKKVEEAKVETTESKVTTTEPVKEKKVEKAVESGTERCATEELAFNHMVEYVGKIVADRKLKSEKQFTDKDRVSFKEEALKVYPEVSEYSKDTKDGKKLRGKLNTSIFEKVFSTEIVAEKVIEPIVIEEVKKDTPIVTAKTEEELLAEIDNDIKAEESKKATDTVVKDKTTEVSTAKVEPGVLTVDSVSEADTLGNLISKIIDIRKNKEADFKKLTDKDAVKAAKRELSLKVTEAVKANKNVTEDKYSGLDIVKNLIKQDKNLSFARALVLDCFTKAAAELNAVEKKAV
jgi:hypothetical protein